MNKFYMCFKNPKLKTFVGVRINHDLLQQLKKEANKENKDISKTIRDLCKEALSQRIRKPNS